MQENKSHSQFYELTEEDFSFNGCSRVTVIEMLKGIDMEAIQLRSDFHRLIDNFSDVKMLEQLYEVISEYQNRKTEFDILDELTKDQQVRLKDSIKQAQTGRTVSHGEVKGNIKDWLRK